MQKMNERTYAYADRSKEANERENEVKEREKKSRTKRNREKMKRAGWLMAVTRTCQVHARMRPRTQRTKDDRRINAT
jgi:hypothetical protein